MANFNDIFKNIDSRSFENLEAKRRSTIILLTTFWIFVVLIHTIVFFLTIKIIYSNEMLPYFALFVFILLVKLYATITIRIYKSYTEYYGVKLIKKMILTLNDSLVYNDYSIKEAINESYINSSFYENCKIKIEDCISGKTNLGDIEYDVMLAEVISIYDKNKSMKTYFEGIFGRTFLKNSYQGKIIINKKDPYMLYSDNGILLDSPEFESKFRSFSDDEIRSRQLLTSETMQLLLDFSTKIRYPFDIIIEGNQILLRVNCGKLFEPNLFKRVLDIKTLKTYYDIIEFSYQLPILLDKSLENTN